ncbi:MAG: sialate O-acetylesterase [Bacteroides sp.]
MCFLSFSSLASTPLQKETFHLFLLMGQSNMAGYGMIMPEDRKVLDGVYMLRDSVEKGQTYSWVPANQPIHARLQSDRFCLAGPFAEAYRMVYPRTVVGLVPVAYGGASVIQMEKGTKVYAEAVAKAKWAKEQGCLKAVLWHQGESDTVSPVTATAYERRLTKLIHDLRTDLNDPDLLVIVGDLAPFYGIGKDHSAPQRVEQIEQVRTALRHIADKLPSIGYVETDGLQSHDHHQVHFDRESYVILGLRYMDVYWKIRRTNYGQ